MITLAANKRTAAIEYSKGTTKALATCTLILYFIVSDTKKGGGGKAAGCSCSLVDSEGGQAAG